MEKKGLLARIKSWYEKSMVGEFLNSHELDESDNGIIDNKSFKNESKETIDALNKTIMNVTPKEFKNKPNKRLNVEKIDDVEYKPQEKTEKEKPRATGKEIEENY